MNKPLKKSLSFPSLVILGAAGVIGSGWIYMTSAFFSSYGAGGVVFGMIIASVLACCISLAFAELSSQYPRAGGDLLFVFIAYNRTCAFAIGWLLIGAFVSSTAFYMAALGSLITKGFPAITSFMESVPLYSVAGSQVYLFGLAFGLALVLVFYFLNRISVDMGANAQKVLFLLKVFLGVLLAGSGIALGQWSNFWPAFEQSVTQVNLLDSIFSTVRFVIPALTFLTGFSLVSLLAEEANISPNKIGKAVVLAIALAGIYYVLVLLGTAMIIPWKISAQLELGAISTFGQADYPFLSYAAMGIAFLGMGTGSLALSIASSRIMLAMGRGGLLPEFMGKIDKNGVPKNALTLTLILTVILGSLGKSAMVWFLNTGGVYIGIAWVMVVLSMYRIRKLKPSQPRPYKVRLSWLPALGGLAASLVILMILIPNTSLSLTGPEYSILLLWLVLGLIVYWIQSRRNTQTQAQSLENMLGQKARD